MSLPPRLLGGGQEKSVGESPEGLLALIPERGPRERALHQGDLWRPGAQGRGRGGPQQEGEERGEGRQGRHGQGALASQALRPRATPAGGQSSPPRLLPDGAFLWAPPEVKVEVLKVNTNAEDIKVEGKDTINSAAAARWFSSKCARKWSKCAKKCANLKCQFFIAFLDVSEGVQRSIFKKIF